MQNKCEDCYYVYYDYFCSYKARWCKKHGCIDCNPNSYVNTLKDKECPDFSPRYKWKWEDENAK